MWKFLEEIKTPASSCLFVPLRLYMNRFSTKAHVNLETWLQYCTHIGNNNNTDKHDYTASLNLESDNYTWKNACSVTAFNSTDIRSVQDNVATPVTAMMVSLYQH